MSDFRIYKNFIEEEHRLSFLKDVEKNKNHFYDNPNGPFRKCLRLDDTNFFNNLHNYYLKKISIVLGLDSVRIDPMLGILYSIITKGGYIHPHIDSYPPYDKGHFVNYRFNMMLNRNIEKNYNPIIKNNSLDIQIGDAWSFSSSLCEHKTLIFESEEPRIVIQYGFMLDKGEYENLFSNEVSILTNRMKEYYAKNSRNGITRSRKNFFSQSSEIISSRQFKHS